MKSAATIWVLGVLGCVLLAGVAIQLGWLAPDAVTALATTALAATGVIGLVGVLRPIQQEIKRTRKQHLDTLVTHVVDSLAEELNQKYLGVLKRTTIPLQWDNGQGLHWAPVIMANSYVLDFGRNERIYEKYYQDIKENHYKALFGRIENFKRDFVTFGNDTVIQARALETELRTFTDLPESNLNQGERWFNAGSLALYIFNVLWMTHYDGELTGRRDPVFGLSFNLQDVSRSTHYARGSSEEIAKLRQFVESIVARHDRAAFTKSSGEMLERLIPLQNSLADIQTSDILEGDCKLTR